MTTILTDSTRELLSIKVHQWLDEWENIKFSPKLRQRKPEPHFYMFTLSANKLKQLAGIYRRPSEDGFKRESDDNIQRRHNKQRSIEIRKFVEVGYPLSEINLSNQSYQELSDLQKPGWLPTSIVINILSPNDIRRNQKVAQEDLIKIQDIDNSTSKIILPNSFTEKKWEPTFIHPIEVIDGQHRLWAFDGSKLKGNYELPVVAFYGLDISWQAYLFWVINIKPKRINMSLAFDLYPLLRTEDWLEKFEGPKIYRETRAQEITEALWSYHKSCWHQRIDMMGEHRQTMVSQAAWINSLLNTYIKAWEGRGIRIGGLYGAPVGKDKTVLEWSRVQQAAYLILIWNTLQDAVRKTNAKWAESLRRNKQKSLFNEDLAFSGNSTLLNTDQGVRGVMYITNDISYFLAGTGKLPLSEWRFDESDIPEPDTNGINSAILDKAIDSIRTEDKIIEFIDQISEKLSGFDWRSASAENLSEEEKTSKLVFRGSGGYRELRRQLLKHLIVSDDNIGQVAADLYKVLGFDS